MAETLFGGSAMHGDIALVEAALSARCFYRLTEIGVSFPHNRYGEYVGYKTDHDPMQRAASAGPLTSKFMTEKLQEQVERNGIPVFDGFQVIGILTDRKKSRSIGLLTLNLNELETPDHRYALFNCTNIIYATGGPAGMYASSVYPESQTGSSGLAFEAGVTGQNLTESQFGIASLPYRWNLSGTYQQVLPRYVSTDMNGNDEREFLNYYFDDPGRMLDAVFFKGYQWPFDPGKVLRYGSSLIDILVYHETVVRKRRVFLDYAKNPSSALKNGDLDFSLLGTESSRYLKRSGACFGQPIERLIRMNKPAVELFYDHGIDLGKEYLEIAVCAQHNNGGLRGNIWWESNVKHFFPVGEVNGSHGVFRPGGSALNSGQVGGIRAAQFISHRYGEEPPGIDTFLDTGKSQIEEKLNMGGNFLETGKESTVSAIRTAIGKRMDLCGSVIRSLDTARSGMNEARNMLDHLVERTRLDSVQELPGAFKNYDLLLSQYVYLSAIVDYIEHRGKSRGSFFVQDAEGVLPSDNLPEIFRFSLDNRELSGRIQGVSLDDKTCRFEWEPVRPIPGDEGWFENVWNDFLEDRIIT